MVDQATEKVTFNMPVTLKHKLYELRDEMKVSLSSMYNEAISNYIREKELLRWQRAAELACQDDDYMQTLQENQNEDGKLYEYRPE